MAAPNIIVDLVSALPPVALSLDAQALRPEERFITLQFASDQSARLDMSSPQAAVWASVLDSLRLSGQPAYVEVDPSTNVVSTLLIPLRVRVASLTPTAAGDAVEVELIISHARHTLRRDHPDFDRLLAALEQARDQGAEVLVTESPESHAIIDVRPAGVQ